MSLRRIAEVRIRNMSCKHDAHLAARMPMTFLNELMAEEKVRQGFIGAILNVDPEEIKETRLMPTLLRKGSKEEKLGILDVRVLLQDGKQMDLEMQVIIHDSISGKIHEERSIRIN